MGFGGIVQVVCGWVRPKQCGPYIRWRLEDAADWRGRAAQHIQIVEWDYVMANAFGNYRG